MKKIFLFLSLFTSLFVFAQNEQLAINYFDKGEFEKAIISFDELLKNQQGNSFYFQKIIESYQQLQQYDQADKRLQERYAKYKQPSLLVEIGYNYQLQKDAGKAKKFYEQAISKINENPSNVYAVANTFEKKSCWNMLWSPIIWQ